MRDHHHSNVNGVLNGDRCEVGVEYSWEGLGFTQVVEAAWRRCRLN